MLNKYISQVLVLSLADDVDRRKHINTHFKDNGLDNYQFVDAIPYDSALVVAAYKKGIVKTYPSCFRCGKNTCKCANNILIPHQVANWLSFKRIWEKVADAAGPVLVCEDDVFFYESGLEKLNSKLDELLSNTKHLPILIRLGHSGLSTEVIIEESCDLQVSSEVVMSNVAHIMTPIFAQHLLEQFEHIETTSDIWIHDWIANQTCIQAFTIEPLIATDLSFNKKFAIFRSRIHPKGIDAEDNVRALSHIKRVDTAIEYHEYLCEILGSREDSKQAIENWDARDSVAQILNKNSRRSITGDDAKAIRLIAFYPALKSFFLPSQADIFTAQEGEDVLLRRLLKHYYFQQSSYVDVGSHHPTRFSNTFHYYLKGWTGINIDPLPGSKSEFELLRPNDINLELGIAEEPGILEYFQFKEPAFNTFDKGSVDYAVTRTDLVNSIKIPVERLDSVLEKYQVHLDRLIFISIDVEGLELPVLRSNNWDKYRPKIIIVEALTLLALTEIEVYLTEQKYVRVASTKNSYFFSEIEFWEEVR